MSDTVETPPLAVPRDRSVEAWRAARQAKARRERRIIELLNRGVPVAEIAELEDVGEKHMRALVREALARRMPEPPAQFAAMQPSRLEEALRMSFDAMSGANLRAVDRVVKIVRELDRYHGFAAAERWRLAEASHLETREEREARDEKDKLLMTQFVERIRRNTLEEVARGNAMAAKTPDPHAFASALDSAGAPPIPPANGAAKP